MAGLEPEKLDKDCIRDWVKSVCDPYKEDIPEIPEDIVKKAYDAYKKFYDMISSVEMSNLPVNNNNLVVIMSGSEKDAGHVEKIEKALTNESINHRAFVSSAHKNTQDVLDLIKNYDDYNRLNRRIVWVTVAGRSNALSGVVAANSRFPVIACPPFANQTDMMVNINSTIQCPSKVPVMTILEPSNVSLAIRKIFDLHN
jgi:5-(carboxyamino)imidazole ribonucleotide mutase